MFSNWTALCAGLTLGRAFRRIWSAAIGPCSGTRLLFCLTSAPSGGPARVRAGISDSLWVPVHVWLSFPSCLITGHNLTYSNSKLWNCDPNPSQIMGGKVIWNISLKINVSNQPCSRWYMSINQIGLCWWFYCASDLAAHNQLHKTLFLHKMIRSFIYSLVFFSKCLLIIYSVPSSIARLWKQRQIETPCVQVVGTL